jgi:hypothetical protein
MAAATVAGPRMVDIRTVMAAGTADVVKYA